MLKISFDNPTPKKILCLGAHCDDIEIGCGGSILKFVGAMKDISIYWVVFSSDDRREKEALKSAKDFLFDVKNKKIELPDEFEERPGAHPVGKGSAGRLRAGKQRKWRPGLGHGLSLFHYIPDCRKWRCRRCRSMITPATFRIYNVFAKRVKSGAAGLSAN